MTKQEFENWYIQKKRWLKDRAHYLLHQYNIDYSEVNELVSITLEALYYKLPELRLETLDSYSMVWMRNLMFNQLTYYTRKISSEGDWEQPKYSIEDSVYDIIQDELIEQELITINSRAINQSDRILIQMMKDGVNIYSKEEGRLMGNNGLTLQEVRSGMRRLKGLKAYKQYKKPTGNPRGRPKKTQDEKIYS